MAVSDHSAEGDIWYPGPDIGHKKLWVSDLFTPSILHNVLIYIMLVIGPDKVSGFFTLREFWLTH